MLKHLSLFASLAVLTFAVPAFAHDDPGAWSARSTHDHHQLHDLVNGKVYIARFHAYDADSVKGNAKNAARIVYYAPDKTVHACTYAVDKKHNISPYGYGASENWSTEPHRKRLARLRYLAPGDDPVSNQKTTAMEYEPSTGRFNNLFFYKGRYFIGTDGHLQASIPAVVYDLCPDFPTPEALGLPLNAEQTSSKYSVLLGQDPSAPIKNFFTAPPAAPAVTPVVGNDKTSSLEATEGAAFSLKGEAASFVAQTNGQFITDDAGRFYSYAPLTSQLLQIEGEAKVVRYANVSFLEGSPQTYRVAWNDGEVDLWPIDKPLPFKATGLESRIGAFFAWLDSRLVTANIDGFLNERVTFKNERVLFMDNPDGPGHHFAKGDNIIIRLPDGLTRSFHWTELAAAFGWEG